MHRSVKCLVISFGFIASTLSLAADPPSDGVTIAILGMVLFANINQARGIDDYRTVIPIVMAGVGAVVGLVIAIIQEKTALTSDTVIPITPIPVRASLTSSSLNGLMMASIFFIFPPGAVRSTSRARIGKITAKYTKSRAWAR